MSQVVQVDPAGRLHVFKYLLRVNGVTSDKGQNLAGFAPKALLIIGTLTATAITFQGAIANKEGNDINQPYFPVQDGAGSAATVTVASNQFVAFPAALQALLLGVPFLKLVPGTVQAAQEIEVYLLASALP